MLDLQPPRDEIDAEGRHVHPYVRNENADPSLRKDAEQRTLASQIAFHEVEGLLQYLSPFAQMLLMDALWMRLTPARQAEGSADFGPQLTPDQLDPFGEAQHVEQLHAETLEELGKLLEKLVNTCPDCGKVHPGTYRGEADRA